MKVIMDKDIPNRLYKFFDRKEHADNFIEGNIYLRPPESYRKIEGPRQDQSEGLGSIKIVESIRQVSIPSGKWSESPGHMNTTIQFLNPTYILCLSGSKVSSENTKRKFGEYGVEVQDIKSVAESIKTFLEKNKLNGFSVNFIKCARIAYNKDNVFTSFDIYKNFNLSFEQKPSDYSDEDEYRLTICLELDLDYAQETKEPPYLFLQLEDMSQFVKRI